MANRVVIQAGHPALKATNKTVTDFSAKDVKKVIKDLHDTMYETGLVGIAAPQIAENFMIFVTHPRNTDARKLPKADISRVFINPKIVATTDETVMIYEACGSLGTDLFGPVIRPRQVTVEAYDEKGVMFRLTTDGLLGRVIQHEFDHLHGIEFIQKVSDYNAVMSKEFYIKRLKNTKEEEEAAIITKIEFQKLS